MSIKSKFGREFELNYIRIQLRQETLKVESIMKTLEAAMEQVVDGNLKPRYFSITAAEVYNTCDKLVCLSKEIVEKSRTSYQKYQPSPSTDAHVIPFPTGER